VAAATAGPAPLNGILLRHGLQFFDAPTHLSLAPPEGSAEVSVFMARTTKVAGRAGSRGLAPWSGPARMQAMAKALTADDILPLVASLTLQERVRLLRLIASPQGADASVYRSLSPSRDEFSADEEPLAWEAEGWEDIG
jgi:hypothetical protein